jgi:adenylosuccinate synthase
MPGDVEDLTGAQPIYEEMDGWPDAPAAEVPAAASRFVERVSSLVRVPVWATSWGPGRSQTIVTHQLF